MINIAKRECVIRQKILPRHTCVDSPVDDKLPGLDERLAADITLMRSLSGVDPHVAVEFSRVLEAATAVLAGVGPLLGVDPPVDGQVLLDGKRLITELALERLLTGVYAVVPGQPGWYRECLVTLVTLVDLGGRLARVHFLIIIIKILLLLKVLERSLWLRMLLRLRRLG